ncbi:MAG: SAF domain-containing protein [Lachnospiraceae bacterium]
MKRKKDKEASQESILKRWLVVVCVAFTTAMIVFMMLLEVEQTVLSDYEKGSVVVATKEIEKGTVLTYENILQYITVKEIPLEIIPSSAVSVESLDGYIASVTIAEGVILSEGLVVAEDEIISGLQNPVIIGFSADDLYQVVGGVLRAGDYIQIYHVSREEQDEMYTWDCVYVEEVFDNSGISLSRSDTTTPAQRINIYMEESEVGLFFEVLEKGTVRVAKIMD